MQRVAVPVDYRGDAPTGKASALGPSRDQRGRLFARRLCDCDDSQRGIQPCYAHRTRRTNRHCRRLVAAARCGCLAAQSACRSDVASRVSAGGGPENVLLLVNSNSLTRRRSPTTTSRCATFRRRTWSTSIGAAARRVPGQVFREQILQPAIKAIAERQPRSTDRLRRLFLRLSLAGQPQVAVSRREIRASVPTRGLGTGATYSLAIHARQEPGDRDADRQLVRVAAATATTIAQCAADGQSGIARLSLELFLGPERQSERQDPTKGSRICSRRCSASRRAAATRSTKFFAISSARPKPTARGRAARSTS